MAFEFYLSSRYRYNEKFNFNVKMAYNDEIYTIRNYTLNNSEYQSVKNESNYIYLKGMNVFFGITYKLIKPESKN